jgi:hypothetical protein
LPSDPHIRGAGPGRRMRNPRHAPDQIRGGGYPKEFRNDEKFRLDTAPGTELQEFPLGETSFDGSLKYFEGTWAHHTNLARAFFEKDTEIVVGMGWHPHDRSFIQAKGYHYGLPLEEVGIKVWMCWDDDSELAGFTLYLWLLSNDSVVG